MITYGRCYRWTDGKKIEPLESSAEAYELMAARKRGKVEVFDNAHREAGFVTVLTYENGRVKTCLAAIH